MRKFFNRIFGTKYKIYPVYENFKQVGVIVYEKCFLSPLYVGSSLDVMDNGKLAPTGKAAFKTRDEAIEFIKARTKYYTYETIQTDKKPVG